MQETAGAVRARTRTPWRTVCVLPADLEAAELEHRLQQRAPMTITMGQLVSQIYEAYGRELGDPQLAAVATEVRIAELRVPKHRRAWRRVAD